MGVLPACVSVHHMPVWCHEGQKRAGFDTLGTAMWVLGIEPELYSSLLSHLSSLDFCVFY